MQYEYVIMIELSTDELDFFKGIFSEETEKSISPIKNFNVYTSIPKNLKKVLGESKLTLLAEISHYQLWFPVSLSFQSGNLVPIIETPEIIDVRGNERSWRVNTPETLSLLNSLSDQGIEILSISGTGVTLRVSDDKKINQVLNCPSLELILPDRKPVTLALDVVRTNKNIISAKFINFDRGKEPLRQFLFNSHKAKYSELYQDMML
jgi:hypothetical protein